MHVTEMNQTERKKHKLKLEIELEEENIERCQREVNQKWLELERLEGSDYGQLND